MPSPGLCSLQMRSHHFTLLPTLEISSSHSLEGKLRIRMVITCLRSQASNCWGWHSHLMPEAGFMSSKVGMIRKPVTLRAVTLSLFTQLHNQLPGSNLGRIQRYPQDERRQRERERERETRLGVCSRVWPCFIFYRSFYFLSTFLRGR